MAFSGYALDYLIENRTRFIDIALFLQELRKQHPVRGMFGKRNRLTRVIDGRAQQELSSTFDSINA
ncbi:MAG: hypothetical protein R3A47_10685 [Polyangiales bacterium]